MIERRGPALLRRRAVWAAGVGFWLFVTAMSAAQTLWIARASGQPMQARWAMVWQTAYFVAWIPFTLGVWHVTRDWLPERFGGWSRLLLAHVPLFGGVALGHTFLVAVLMKVLGAQEQTIWENFVRQLRGQLNLELLVYAAIVGTGAAMALHERDRDRQVAAAQLQGELAAARLQALRGHLQPHFLFNSLHSIAALARTGDTASVVRLIAGLSELLRHVLDAGDRQTSLREELQIVERYLDIQRARFADRLQVTVDLAADVADARVPLLVVQPLIENAVRHGLAPQVAGGRLTVRARRDAGRTRIEVEDTGAGLARGWSLHASSGTGLRNLASRLAAEFGDAAALEVRPREGGGVLATVTLPYARL